MVFCADWPTDVSGKAREEGGKVVVWGTMRWWAVND
jgi:hypothetical protein